MLIPVQRQKKESFSGPDEASVRVIPTNLGEGPFSLGRVCLHGVSQSTQERLFLTCADVCANSGPLSEEMLHVGPMGHVSVPFRHAPGGADVFQKDRDAVPSRKVVVLRSLGKIVNRASWGCRTTTDLRLWTCTLRRARRLRSRLSSVMSASRPRFPHRYVPKSGAGSVCRLSGGAQGCGFLGELLAGKLLFAMCPTAANVARQGYGC